MRALLRGAALVAIVATSGGVWWLGHRYPLETGIAAAAFLAGAGTCLVVTRHWGVLVGWLIHLERWGPTEQRAFLQEIHHDPETLLRQQQKAYLAHISGETPAVEVETS